MTTEDKLRGFIVDELGTEVSADELTDDYLIRDQLDSLGLFELVSFIESEFGVEIPNEQLVPQNFDTIGGIARLVERQMAHS
ncbi:MAG: acyl carrier protein [Actinomycetota bacterium]